MKSDPPRRPARSPFAFGALPTNSKPSSPPSLPPSTPTTPPTQPAVRLPGTYFSQEPTPPDSRRGSNSSNRTYSSTKESILDQLAPVPHSFLYNTESRKALPGINDGDLDIARCFARACGEEKPEPDFKSYKADKALTATPVDAHADAATQPVQYDKHTFMGAALPDMSKAVLSDPLSRVLDAQFYKRTRSYLPYCGVGPEWSFVKICESAFFGKDEEVKRLEPTDAASNNFLKKTHSQLSLTCPAKGTQKGAILPSHPVELSPTTTWTNEHRPTTTWLGGRGPTARRKQQEPGGVVTTAPAMPETMRYELVFPQLAPSTACEKSMVTNEGNLCGHRLERLINLWGIPNLESLALAKPEPTLDPDSTAKAMADFEKVMSSKDESGAASPGLCVPSTGTHGLATRTTTAEPISPHLRRRCRGPIYRAAVSAANAFPNETNSAKIVECPTPPCTALVPARLYQHQYLGWRAHFQYSDSTWGLLGAGRTLKKSEQDFDDQSRRASSIKKLVDGIAQDLGLDQKHEEGCCYANEKDDSWFTEPASCPEGSKIDEITSWPSAPWNGPDEETDGVDFGLELLFGEDRTYEGLDVNAPSAGESQGKSPGPSPSREAQVWDCTSIVELEHELVESPDGEEEGDTSASAESKSESDWSDVKVEEGWDTDEDWTDDEAFF